MDSIPDITPQSAPPAPTFQDDDDDIAMPEAAVSMPTAVEREQAYGAVYTWDLWNERLQVWEPTLLKPLSQDRWCWWHRLELHNAPPPAGSALSDAHIPTAWSLLWLLTHDPEEILTLVPSPELYWYAVNEWAVLHCPGEKWPAALQLMQQLESTTKLTLAIHRPTKGRKGPGNAPSP